jgi:cellulose synthase (UDP-forming)
MNDITTSEKLFKKSDYVFFTILTLLNFSAIAYFMVYWFSSNEWRDHPLIFSIITLILSAILVNSQGRWFVLLYMRRPKPMVARAGWKVAVVTTFVPGAEPLDMLEETVQALVALDYPHDTWVLDEGDEAQVKALCYALGAQHFSRKSFPHYHTAQGTFQSHSKHGNYNAWLAEVGFKHYDIITAFDPDHVPKPSFLDHVLGYFEDPQVGYVQVAPAYYNQETSFIARGAAEETYAFYSTMQMASYGLGDATPNEISDYYQMPQIIGCHNTHRVTALRQIGGFAPHDADDLLATLFYWASGWRGVYVPQILARGLTPVDWQGYLTQQRRWARSILDIKLRIYPQFAQELSWTMRLMSILHGLNYLHKSLIILASLMLLASMLAIGTVPQIISYPMLPKLAGVFFTSMLCELYRQRFYVNPQQEWGLHWRAALLYLAKWPYMLLALYDVISRNKFSYAITRKTKHVSNSYMLLLPNILIITLICLAWGIGMVNGHITNLFLHISTLGIVVGALGLILSNHRHFPEPYDKNLRRQVMDSPE